MRAPALYLRVASTVAIAVATACAARAQVSNDEMNASNNPLSPSIAFNLQNSYTARIYGLSDADSNAFLLRGALPHKLFGMPQLLRLTLPVVTTPDLPPAGRHTGLGDLNIFDIVLFKESGFEWGIGPQLTIPTASRDEQGTGKWQAGLATMAIVPQRWGLLGGLLTWQHSFAGDDDRPTQNNMQLQPLIIYNLPQGWYLRSTAVWTFDFAHSTHVIPVGAGLGKVFKSGRTTINAFVEPQWSVSHEGDGLPKFQVFFGLNLQFPL
ncbi:hypothetical protein [Roseateles violae]|uniref:Outer membrane beta-barrel porin/alpha-amylase n=1 Tax=Roseateles violae TaxID=3058042 RepID=A0ABT8DY72_9BURK|nr:hypothetical protein [Pelomonas sp. PFR6]MDN3922169.1 hypothetical protein [Pelomonas sp. PFR6]